MGQNNKILQILSCAGSFLVVSVGDLTGLDKADLDYQPLIIVVEVGDETSVSV
ncbi:hypothetical protein T09_10013 [Trichinella sp. T9]|nr:hypothetical protein T09_10013 [Trichinella sp. T9]